MATLADPWQDDVRLVGEALGQTDAAEESLADRHDSTLVDTSYWVSGVGPLGGRRVLDDVDRVLDEG